MKLRNQLSSTCDIGRKYVNLERQTKQVDDSDGNDTDVNNIVARFARTGILPPATSTASYSDVSEVGELAEVIAKGRQAEADLQKIKKEQLEAEQNKTKADQEELKRLRELSSQTTPETQADV